MAKGANAHSFARALAYQPHLQAPCKRNDRTKLDRQSMDSCRIIYLKLYMYIKIHVGIKRTWCVHR